MRRSLGLLIALALISGCTGPQPTPTASADARPGRDDTLRFAYWTKPSTVNNHFGRGATDDDVASLVLEPLARLGPDGEPVPALAAEIPTAANGGISTDRTTVTWRLRSGVVWSDGAPLTSADVVATFDLVRDPEARATTRGLTTGVRAVEAVDPLTVRVTFERPTVTPYQLFVGPFGHILQAAQFAACRGAAARECPDNAKPIGTGPFVVEGFTEDLVLYRANDRYREVGKPYFGRVELRGGLDPLATARMVMLTDDADYAWNVQLGSVDLASVRDAPGTKGRMVFAVGPEVQRVALNHTDPDPALGDDRSEPGHPHPFLSDLRVRTALARAIERSPFGRAIPLAEPTCNIVTGAPRSTSTTSASLPVCVGDLAAAERLLDEAGWGRGPDGVRARGGRQMRMTLTTTVDPTRQRVQEIVKEAWGRLGVLVQLKVVDRPAFFSREGPDSSARFYGDAQLLGLSRSYPDAAEMLGLWRCDAIGTRAASWTGANIERWCDPAYDRMHDAMRAETDPTRRVEMAARLNDRLVEQVVFIPLWARRSPFSAVRNGIEGVEPNPWDSEMWNVAAWTRRS